MKKTPVLIAVALLVIIIGGMLFLHPGSQTGLTSKMRKEFGAAVLLPAETSAFSSSKFIGPRWQRIQQSHAIRRIMNLPAIQGGLLQLRMNPIYQNVMQTLSVHPLAIDARPVLKDAFSTEIFMWAGPEMPSTLESLNTVVNAARLAQLRNSINPSDTTFDAVVETFLDEKENLTMPPMLLGFKLTDSTAAQNLLDKWLPKLEQHIGQKIQRESLPVGDFFVMRLHGTDIPDDVLRDIAAEFTQGDAVGAWLKKQHLVLAAGVSHDYLLLALGADTTALDGWGHTANLAESAAFAPLRKHFKPGIIDLQYISSSLAAAAQLDPSDLDKAKTEIDDLLELMPENPGLSNLKTQIKKDVVQLCDDLSERLPTPSAHYRFTVENQGLETISLHTAPALTMQTLSLLNHRGDNESILASARVAPPNGADTYELMVKWLKILYGYTEDYVVPEMNETDRQTYETSRDLLLPFITHVHQITQESFIPAVDGTQSLVVLDGHGELQHMPMASGQTLTLSPPLPLLRIGLAFTLRDVAKFKRAMTDYKAAVNDLLTQVSNHRDAPPQFDAAHLPPLKYETTQTGGEMYYYQWPWTLGDDVFPCAIIHDDLLIISSSKPLARAMTTASPPQKNTIVDIKSPAARIAVGNLTEFWTYLERLNQAGFTLITGNGGIQPMQRGIVNLIRMHIDTVLQSLKVFRTYTCTVRHDDGMVIRHSWSEIKDIE